MNITFTQSLKRHLFLLTPVVSAALAAVSLTLSLAAPAQAVDKTQLRQAEQRFQQERAVCNSGRSNQDRSTCLLEAQSAYSEARRGVLGDGESAMPANSSQRCQALAGDDRQDCMARMSGRGTTSGSVEGGGIYRELKSFIVEVPAPTPANPSANPPANPPANPAVQPPAAPEAAASSATSGVAPK